MVGAVQREGAKPVSISPSNVEPLSIKGELGTVCLNEAKGPWAPLK